MSYNGIEEAISQLYEIIQDARSVPLSSDKCMVERDQILDLLDEISNELPNELKQAKTIVDSRSEVITSAKRDAEAIRKQAQQDAKRMASEEAVYLEAKAQAEDGTTYEVRAAKGVVLATGGFSGSPEMLRQYNTMWPFEEGVDIPTTNTYGHTGDGINMALALGAGVALMDDQMPFPMADCKNSSDETTVGDDIDCMMINSEGVRFMDEVRDRYSMTADIMEQPGQMMYMITDADTCRVEGDLNRYGHKLESLINQGQLYVADTIEELAAQIGCEGSVLAKTVEDYNEAARSGVDAAFGRTSFSDLSPIENPPFYASPRTWAMHITVGGLLYDDSFRVTTEEGEPIEGLYAVGETIVGSSGVGTQGEGLAVAQILAEV